MKENLLFTFETIPHKLQRYPSVGDYQEQQFDDETAVCFTISKMSNWRYMLLVMVHELIEYSIVKHQKIPLRKIDAWDIAFEKQRSGRKDETKIENVEPKKSLC